MNASLWLRLFSSEGVLAAFNANLKSIVKLASMADALV
jgi:hypothetical protein